jgi:hypothetical protein
MRESHARVGGMKLFVPISLIFCLACASAPVSPDPVDWQAADEHWSVHIVTVDPDGGERTTRIWLAAVGNRGALRTGDSRWRHNLQRDPNCRIRFAGQDYPVRAEFATEHAEKVRIDEAFEAKYGWQERLMFSQDRGETHDHYAYLHAGDGR